MSDASSSSRLSGWSTDLISFGSTIGMDVSVSSADVGASTADSDEPPPVGVSGFEFASTSSLSVDLAELRDSADIAWKEPTGVGLSEGVFVSSCPLGGDGSSGSSLSDWLSHDRHDHPPVGSDELRSSVVEDSSLVSADDGDSGTLGRLSESGSIIDRTAGEGRYT